VKTCQAKSDAKNPRISAISYKEIDKGKNDVKKRSVIPLKLKIINYNVFYLFKTFIDYVIVINYDY
jgi:hypothetical protein